MLKPYKEGCRSDWLSECCGAIPIAKDMYGNKPLIPEESRVGKCSDCHDNAVFEPVEHDWKCIGTDPAYGADADGNRGAMLREWECCQCGEITEIIGE